jgi:hypothetical protein
VASEKIAEKPEISGNLRKPLAPPDATSHSTNAQEVALPEHSFCPAPPSPFTRQRSPFTPQRLSEAKSRSIGSWGKGSSDYSAQKRSPCRISGLRLDNALS